MYIPCTYNVYTCIYISANVYTCMYMFMIFNVCIYNVCKQLYHSTVHSLYIHGIDMSVHVYARWSGFQMVLLGVLAWLSSDHDVSTWTINWLAGCRQWPDSDITGDKLESNNLNSVLCVLYCYLIFLLNSFAIIQVWYYLSYSLSYYLLLFKLWFFQYLLWSWFASAIIFY